MKVVNEVREGKWYSGKWVEDSYVLQENEYFTDTWYLKPSFTGTEVVESITQQEIDDRAELEEENQFLRETIEQLQRGDELAKDIFSFVRKHSGLTTNQKSVLKGLAILLIQGDIEQAKTDFDAIQRPTNANKMQKVYDKLKIKFDAL